MKNFILQDIDSMTEKRLGSYQAPVLIPISLSETGSKSTPYTEGRTGSGGTLGTS